MKIRWTWIACLALMTSCGKEIPNDIIQPDAMEEVLYDYHLAIGMGQSNKNTEREAYKNYLFQKHRITQAEFDSSMVWYTRESQELTEIYENLDKRFKRQHAHFERLMDTRDQAKSMSFTSGDTVNIWRKGAIHWMSNTPLTNQLTFEIKPDTTFYTRDAFRWNMNYDFLAAGKAIMGMNVVYENDSVIGETKLIETSGPQDIYLHTDSTYKVKELNGFIHVLEDSVQNPMILVHGIALNRYHMSEPTDSISSDSIQTEKAESPTQDTRTVRRPKQDKMIQLKEKE